MRVITRWVLAVTVTMVTASLTVGVGAAQGQPPPPPVDQCWSDHRDGYVACINGYGWEFSEPYECWLYLPQPSPPATYPPWGDQYPSGDIHWGQCIRPFPWDGYDQSAWPGWVPPPYGQGDIAFGALWMPGGPTPEELAALAIADLLAQMQPPAVDSAPPPGAFGFVGLTMWLWADPSPTTWGPLTATASGGGITVTATAQVEDITYTLGDGQSIVCDEGTPYTGGDSASPDCGYVYTTTSADQPGEEYTITGTARWVITWSGGGESGSEEHERSSSVPARVGEVQTIIE